VSENALSYRVYQKIPNVFDVTRRLHKFGNLCNLETWAPVPHPRFITWSFPPCEFKSDKRLKRRRAKDALPPSRKTSSCSEAVIIVAYALRHDGKGSFAPDRMFRDPSLSGERSRSRNLQEHDSAIMTGDSGKGIRYRDFVSIAFRTSSDFSACVHATEKFHRARGRASVTHAA